MNKTQRNFKKQMRDAEYKEHKSAKKNKGVFSNKLFELRFYGYKGEYKKPRNIITKFIIIILKIIFKILKWILILAIVIITIITIIAIIDTIKERAV